jgi:hypothetical protein
VPTVVPNYHVAVVVEDLADAMDELGELLGLQWGEPFTGSSHHVTGSGDVVEAAPRVVLSRQGPPYMELIERRPGTVYADLGLHHLGFWTDDVAAESGRFSAAGCPMEASGATADGTRTGFAYHLAGNDLRLELVDIARVGPRVARHLTSGS